ncbi:hypothetical protein LINGRAHAP2_LOCUS3040 [Linum grandiflorum]
MAATLAMSPRHFPSSLRLGLQHLPRRLCPQLTPCLRPEIPHRLRNNKLSRQPNRPQPSSQPVILKRGPQVKHEKEEPKQAVVEVDHQHDIIEEPKTTTPITTTADDSPKTAEGAAEDDDQHEVNVELKKTTAGAEGLPKAVEGDQNEVKEQEPNQITAEDDDDHEDVKEDEEGDEGVKDSDKKGLWDHYFATIAPSLMAPAPAVVPFPTLLMCKALVN